MNCAGTFLLAEILFCRFSGSVKLYAQIGLQILSE